MTPAQLQELFSNIGGLIAGIVESMTKVTDYFRVERIIDNLAQIAKDGFRLLDQNK